MLHTKPVLKIKTHIFMGNNFFFSKMVHFMR